MRSFAAVGLALAFGLLTRQASATDLGLVARARMPHGPNTLASYFPLAVVTDGTTVWASWQSSGVSYFTGFDPKTGQVTSESQQPTPFAGYPMFLRGDTLLTTTNATSVAADSRAALFQLDRLSGTLVLGQVLDAADSIGVSALALSDEDAVLSGYNYAPVSQNRFGIVYVFERTTPQNQFAMLQRIVPSDGTLSFGSSAAVVGDLLIVGGASAQTPGTEPYGAQLGAVWIFQKNPDSGLFEEKQKLLAADAHDLAAFGATVALVDDLVVVGSPESGNDGSLYTFRRPTPGAPFVQLQQLKSPNAFDYTRLGDSLAVDGRHVLAGATEDRAFPGVSTGVAYLFQLDPVTHLLALQQALNPALRTDMDFGQSLAISGDVVAVGAPLTQLTGTGSLAFFGPPAPAPVGELYGLLLGLALLLVGCVVGSGMADSPAGDTVVAGAAHRSPRSRSRSGS